ncbi:MAG: DEAD/DEAH box helicase family protein [Opitutales bacterium]|nr:DEAD/DEAH box helicase family protein [Opitutales bacterium]
MTNQHPEQIARDKIDQMLRDAGWDVQEKTVIDFSVGRGQAVKEYNTDIGPADYVLFADGTALGVVEAKKETLGQNITVAEDQTKGYSTANLQWIKDKQPLPFLYQATGVITRFTDQRDPRPRSREVFSFHRPETLKAWHDQNKSLRSRLQEIPALNPDRLRDCQVNAITKLERSFKETRPKALIQMATGAGKTYTAITFIYRLIKFAKAKRILFLVDTKNLGEQAEQEFMAYEPSDDNRKFTELYNVQRLRSSVIPGGHEVYISTIQRMYSILQGNELDESDEQDHPAEHRPRRKEPYPVVYNQKVPVEFFDFIDHDECHRSIYNLWQQVLDYFDAFLIGLTATPDRRTFGFFNQNVVSEYSHQDAVADGVNVGNEIYLIETLISRHGGRIEAQQMVEKRDKETRAKRWDTQDEDEEYSSQQLDQKVVTPDQIRTIIKTFKNTIPEIFPVREEIPKTLIFAKTDSHADDIINIVRDEFAESNQFCKKLTYKIKEDPKSVLAQFRNDYYPRIAVTVDMIATGTDVKPLECLLFMRDVKSRNYFEQMKGRGTRTLEHDDLKKVTPSAISDKTHYVIIDAIGVTKSVKTSSPSLITKPLVSLKDLAMQVMMGDDDPDTVSSLAGRLARLDRQLTAEDQDKIESQTNGKPLASIVRDLFQALDGDHIEARARTIAEVPDTANPGEAAREQACKELVREAAKPLNGKRIDLLVEIRKEKEQTIDHDSRDQVLNVGWDQEMQDQAQRFIEEFRTFLHQNKDELVALTIFFDQPYRRRDITLRMIKEVLNKLKQDAPKLAPLRIWQAYEQLQGHKTMHPKSELTALVALIRKVSGIDKTLNPFGDTVRKNFQSWIMTRHSGKNPKFTEVQMSWLQNIRDQICTSLKFDRDDLNYPPFDQKGGLGKMHQLFGNEMDALIDELNEELVA